MPQRQECYIELVRNSLCPKFSQESILDIFTVRAAELCVSAYHECNEDSALFWSQALQATFFAWMPSFTSCFQHRVTFCRYSPHWVISVRMHARPEIELEATSTLNSCHSTSAVHFRNSGNNDNMQSAKVFLASLSAKDYHIFGKTSWSCTFM